jgi:four helix bundle protein
MAADREAVLVRKFIETAKLLNVYLNHFPRHEKYALANRIRNAAYQVYDLIVEGQKRYHKKTTLTSLDIAHEQWRMQLYLAYELGYFRFSDGKQGDDAADLEAHRWQAISKLVDELGRMIGGWIRHELAAEKDGGKGK